jgi:hypothetical protein
MADLVVSRLSGGLGNQLFQFAAAFGIAHRSGARVALDVSSFVEVNDGRVYLLERYASQDLVVSGTAFDSTYRTATIGMSAANSKMSLQLPVYRENNYQFEPEAMALRGSVYLYGFWQSWKYFDQVADVLRARIAGACNAGRRPPAVADGEMVAVHVRRGDYLVPDVHEAFGLCDPAYYRRAMALLRERLARPQFLVFSDDPQWCARTFTDPDVAIVSNGHGDVHADLAGMARCRHHIIANSSLSWWGAWLARREGSIVVAPISWYTQSPQAHDLIPPHWIRLDRRTGADWTMQASEAAARKVSIIILAHDAPDGLAYALQDARSQSHANTEIIVALDNPSAAVRRTVEKAERDGAVKVVVAPGRGASCNAAVAAAAGEWVAFLDEGDRWRRDKLQIQVEAAYLNDADVVGCRTVPVAGPTGTPPIFPPAGSPDCSLRDMLRRGYAISGWSHAIVRRDLLTEPGLFDVHGLQRNDIELWRRLGLARARDTRSVIIWDRLVSSPVPFLRGVDAL